MVLPQTSLSYKYFHYATIQFQILLKGVKGKMGAKEVTMYRTYIIAD